MCTCSYKYSNLSNSITVSMTGDKAVFSKKNIFIRCQSSSLLVSNSSSSAGVILNEIMELIKKS